MLIDDITYWLQMAFLFVIVVTSFVVVGVLGYNLGCFIWENAGCVLDLWVVQT